MKNKEKDVLAEIVLNYLSENYGEKLEKLKKNYPSSDKGWSEWAGEYGRKALDKQFEEIFEMYL
jgi:hypothetical protein